MRNCSICTQALCSRDLALHGLEDGGGRSAVNTSRFLTSVSASSRRDSCAPQHQHSPPVFAQTYCRLVLDGFNVPSRVRGAPISLKIIISQRQLQIRSFRLKRQQPKTPDAILVSVARSGLAWFRASTMSLSGAEAVRAIYDAEFRRDGKMRDAFTPNMHDCGTLALGGRPRA